MFIKEELGMLKEEKTAHTLFSKSSDDGKIKYAYNKNRMNEIVLLNDDICFFIMLWLHRFYWYNYTAPKDEKNYSTGIPIH